MSVTVEGAVKWKPQVIQAGDDQFQIRYVCPICKTPNTIVLQPLPWSAPTEADLTTDIEGREVVDEQRRAAGTVKHRDLDQVTTELWCHRCGKGAEVIASAT